MLELIRRQMFPGFALVAYDALATAGKDKAPPPRLAQLRRSDIAAGLVQVKDLDTSSIVTLHGDTLFDPGSAEVNARSRPLFDRIAAALNQVPGHVLVAEFDAARSRNLQPVRTLRPPARGKTSMRRRVIST